MTSRRGGWVKAHRAMLDSPALSSAARRGAWMTLLLLAAREDRETNFRGLVIDLRRGQAVISVSSLAKELDLTRKEMRTIMERFVAQGMIEVGHPKGHTFTLVTVCKYEIYQGGENLQGHANGQRGANEGPTRGQQNKKGENPEDYPPPSLRSGAPPEGGTNDEGQAVEVVPTVPAKKPRKRTVKTMLPEDFELTAERQTVAERLCPGVDADAEYLKFVDRQLASGSKYANWEAVWRNWFRSPFDKVMRVVPFKPAGHDKRSEKLHALKDYLAQRHGGPS